MKGPLVSIALCTYNSGKFLTTLLDSLLAQSYTEIEIVCFDDNSTDSTRETLKLYEQLHKEKFRLFFNTENVGYIKNFEQCFTECSGDYIAIADHDDIWKENKICRLINAIGDAELVYSDSIYIDEYGKEMGKKISDKYFFHDRPDPRSFIFTNVVWGHTAIIKRSLLEKALPIPPTAPYDIWLAYIASNTSYVKYLPEPLTYWRQHSDSFSAKYYYNKKKSSGSRYEEWQTRLKWMNLMEASPVAIHKDFIKKLTTLYEKKNTGKFQWPLFWFLVRNKTTMFKAWRRSFISSINEIRKLSRSIKKSE